MDSCDREIEVAASWLARKAFRKLQSEENRGKVEDSWTRYYVDCFRKGLEACGGEIPPGHWLGRGVFGSPDETLKCCAYVRPGTVEVQVNDEPRARIYPS